MADLKPLGSEKLNGDDKLKRILELAYYKTDNKKNTAKAEIVKESKTGGVYGVVKEKDGYYVKRGLNENSLDYIGGMFMKNKNKFSSYAEAVKRLELIKGQEEYLNEATKYVLKTDKPAQVEAPVPAPAIDDAPPADAALPPLPPADGGEASVEEPLPELPPMEGGEDMGGEEEAPSESKRSDYMAEAQKHAGRLGQELRDIKDKMESDDIKYILNMIISAVDLDKLDDEDIEDIAEKFERDEEQGAEEGGEDNLGGEELGGEELPAEEPVAADEELGEEANPMDALESFINSSIDEEYTDFDEEDLSGLEDEMDELNIADYADLDEEAIDDSMFDFKPDYVSPSLGDDDDVELDESDDFIGKFQNDVSWVHPDNKHFGQGDETDGYGDDETFDDYDTFNSKYQGKHKWFDNDKSFFDMYKNKYGPLNIRSRRPTEMDDDVELDESDDLIGKFDGQASWTRHDNSMFDGNLDDYSDDETFDDYDTFNSKYQGKHKWFGDKGHSTFRMYKDGYGPFSVRNRKPKEMDSEVEIDLDEIKNEINNNIHTTLSKYFK
jgi:hypothetical protein